jgi:DNA-binding GntR family transcriptional regulator
VEADIARQMAISRSPVREAVRKLEHEGLVEYVPRHGTVVVKLAATRATRLLELIEEMRKCAEAEDLKGLLSVDVEFHREVGRASAAGRQELRRRDTQ